MPKDPRPLDELDRALVRLLTLDGRTPNRALAQHLGISESACSARVRSLMATGVIRGIHAEVDPGRLGHGVQAFVSVTLAVQDRAQFDRLRAEIAAVPGLIRAFHVSGAFDYVVHLAAPSPDALRDVVIDHLTSRPGIARVETSLIFDTVVGTEVTGVAGPQRPR